MVVSESLYQTENLITYSITEDTIEVEHTTPDEEKDVNCSSDEMSLGRDVDVYISESYQTENLITYSITEDTIEVENTTPDEARDVNCSSDEMSLGRDVDVYISDVNKESQQDTLAQENEDWGTFGGNHLHVKAIERMMEMESTQMDRYLEQYNDRPKSSKSSSIEDKTITRGNHLYDQAIERMMRLESRQLESYLKQYKESNLRPRSSVCSESDVTVMAGSRLYEQAIERLKRHESRIQEETTKKVRSFHNLVLPTQTRLGKKLLPGYCQVPSFKKRHDHLYAKASTKIEEGRMRRTAIEEARARAKRIPETKILPLSQACDMYNRSMKRLIERNYRLEKLAEILYPESSFESMCTDYSEY